MSNSTEQSRSTKSRAYRMRKRAEDVEQTRRRIIEAAVRLHTTVGPANTTISDLAEEADVTRLTVYRHFPDVEHLFIQCSRHWLSLHPPPDPATWRAIPDLHKRAKHALTELYGWYTDNAGELFPLRRDVAAMPQPFQNRIRATTRAYADAVVYGARVSGSARRRLRAAAGHVVDYWTCRSLTVDQGLRPAEAVEVAVRFLRAAATPSRAAAKR